MSATSFQRMRREQALKAQEAEQQKPAKEQNENKLDNMKVPELKEKAKELNIEGYSNMKREVLIKAINDALELVNKEPAKDQEETKE